MRATPSDATARGLSFSAGPEAAEALRDLVDAIVLVPAGSELRIELKGNLAAMLSAAQNAKRSPEGDLSLQMAMVAGAV